jgi:transposase
LLRLLSLRRERQGEREGKRETQNSHSTTLSHSHTSEQHSGASAELFRCDTVAQAAGEHDIFVVPAMTRHVAQKRLLLRANAL